MESCRFWPIVVTKWDFVLHGYANFWYLVFTGRVRYFHHFVQGLLCGSWARGLGDTWPNTREKEVEAYCLRYVWSFAHNIAHMPLSMRYALSCNCRPCDLSNERSFVSI